MLQACHRPGVTRVTATTACCDCPGCGVRVRAAWRVKRAIQVQLVVGAGGMQLLFDLWFCSQRVSVFATDACNLKIACVQLSFCKPLPLQPAQRTWPGLFQTPSKHARAPCSGAASPPSPEKVCDRSHLQDQPIIAHRLKA